MSPFWGPRGTPKSTPHRSKSLQKRVSEELPKASRKMYRKSSIVGGPWTMKMRLTPWRELNFHVFKGYQKMLQKGSQNGAKIDPKFAPWRSGGASRGLSKKSKKTIPKMTPKVSEIGGQMGAKIEPKMSLKTPVDFAPSGLFYPRPPGWSRGALGEPLGAPWDHFGSHF